MLIQRLQDSWKVSAGSGVAYLSPGKVVIQRADKSEFVVDAPGEYDVSQIFIELHDSVTVLESEGFSLVYLPNPPKSLGEEELKAYENVDVLLLPGGRSDLVTLLAPPLVVPIDQADKLIAALGSELPEQETSLKLRAVSDVPEDTEVVLLA